MPCDSGGYRGPSYHDIECCRVAKLLAELDGKGAPDPYEWDYEWWKDMAYVKTSQESLDASTADLCERLTALGKHVKDYSLEMQAWWRDHQAADIKRIKREAQEKAEAELKARALRKLTKAEKKALGV